MFTRTAVRSATDRRSETPVLPLDTVKLLYKPFGLVLGLLAGVLARNLFNAIWSWVDDREVPDPTTQGVSWGKAVGGPVLQAAVTVGTRAAVERAGARGFENITGVWPGK